MKQSFITTLATWFLLTAMILAGCSIQTTLTPTPTQTPTMVATVEANPAPDNSKIWEAPTDLALGNVQINSVFKIDDLAAFLTVDQPKNLQMTISLTRSDPDIRVFVRAVAASFALVAVSETEKEMVVGIFQADRTVELPHPGHPMGNGSFSTIFEITQEDLKTSESKLQTGMQVVAVAVSITSLVYTQGLDGKFVEHQVFDIIKIEPPAPAKTT